MDKFISNVELGSGDLFIVISRDALMTIKYILNIYNDMKRIEYVKDECDPRSVECWYNECPWNFFFYQKQDVVQNIPFIIGIQTPWMSSMMVRHLDNNVMSMDSTVSTNKYGVSSYLLFFYTSIQLHFNAYILYNYICFVCGIVSTLHFNGLWRTSQWGSSSLGDFFTQYYIWHMQMDVNINCG